MTSERQQSQPARMSQRRSMASPEAQGSGEMDLNPVSAMLQAKRALRVIQKIEQSREERRLTAEAQPSAGSRTRLSYAATKPRGVSLAAPITAAPHTAAPLTGIEIHRALHPGEDGVLDGPGPRLGQPPACPPALDAAPARQLHVGRVVRAAGALAHHTCACAGSGRNRVAPSDSADRDGSGSTSPSANRAKVRWQQAYHDVQAARWCPVPLLAGWLCIKQRIWSSRSRSCSYSGGNEQALAAG